MPLIVTTGLVLGLIFYSRILSITKVSIVIMTVYLYKSTSPGNHIVVSAKINNDGSLIISEFDGSSTAQEHFGGDQESWMKINSLNVDKLIEIMNQGNNTLKRIISQEIKLKKINSRKELLIWLQENFNDICAESNLKKFFSALGISYHEERWP